MEVLEFLIFGLAEIVRFLLQSRITWPWRKDGFRLTFSPVAADLLYRGP